MTQPRLIAAALAAALLAGACGRDIESPDPAKRLAAVRAASDRGARTLAILLVAQRDPSAAVRAAAADGFARHGGPAGADALGALLVDPSPDVAAAAARGLGGMANDARARQRLLAAYADATPGGRAAIGAALDRLGISLREAVEAEARQLWERNAAALEGRGRAARGGAAEELGASGRSDAIQRLLPLVDPARNPDRELAMAAARGLGESGEWSARGALEALLAESDAQLAEVAAGALGRLGDPAAADALAAAGAADAGRIAGAAADALALLPEAPEVGVALCDLAIRSYDPAVSARAAREARRRDAECPERPFLAKLGRPGTAAALAAIGELGLTGAAAQGALDRILPLVERGPDAESRGAAARALARLGGPVAAVAVTRRAGVLAARLAERRSPWIVGVAAPGAPAEWIDPVAADDVVELQGLLPAAGALRIGGSEALLLAHARDPRGELRAAAVEGLASLGTAAAVDAVAAALGDPDRRVRSAAAEGLGRLRARGVAALAKAAAAAPAEAADWRTALARALGDTGSADAVPALAPLLDGPSAGAAALALAHIGAPAGAAALSAYLGRPEAPARADAIEALAQLVARDAAPAIAALLTDDRPEVRAAASRALGRLRHEDASTRLEALRSDYYGRVRRAAVEALSKLPSGAPRMRRP